MTDSRASADQEVEDTRSIKRRTMLGWFGGIALGGAAGVLGTTAYSDEMAHRNLGGSEAPLNAEATRTRSEDWFANTQPGVDRPATPQSFCGLKVLSVSKDVVARDLIENLGRRIAQLHDPIHIGDRLPDGLLDLTMTVGVGARVATALGIENVGGYASHKGEAVTLDLPEFVGDAELSTEFRGGDLMLFGAASDHFVVAAALDYVLNDLPGVAVQWSQSGFRGPSVGAQTRNPFGFHDGVIVPKTTDELAEHVWTGPENAPVTVCAVRRFALDTQTFQDLPLEARERVVGRDIHGAPLSGGEAFSEANLVSKHPNGEFHIPIDSHTRAAHPSFTGSQLMLRRSYTYANGDESGLLFMSFQRELRTFVETQRRMDEVGDALMEFARPTASSSFLILPSFDRAGSIVEKLTLLSEWSRDHASTGEKTKH